MHQRALIHHFRWQMKSHVMKFKLFIKEEQGNHWPWKSNQAIISDDGKVKIACLWFISCSWVEISRKSAGQVREMVSTQWHCLFMYLISRQFCQRIYIHTLTHILCQSTEWSEIGWEAQDIFYFYFFVLKISLLELFSVFTLLNCLSINVTSLKIYFFHQLIITLSIKSAISFPQDYHVLFWNTGISSQLCFVHGGKVSGDIVLTYLRVTAICFHLFY